jgi:hypothetical protein
MFSDNPAWTRKNLLLLGPATFIDHDGPATAFQNLRLMSLYDHQITANGSFSWWGVESAIKQDCRITQALVC